MFKHKATDNIPTKRLLTIQTRLRVRMIEQGELSTNDSVLYLYLTQLLDARCAAGDLALR
jgi:hypothetical protein